MDVRIDVFHLRAVVMTRAAVVCDCAERQNPDPEGCREGWVCRTGCSSPDSDQRLPQLSAGATFFRLNKNVS